MGKLGRHPWGQPQPQPVHEAPCALPRSQEGLRRSQAWLGVANHPPGLATGSAPSRSDSRETLPVATVGLHKAAVPPLL